MQSKTCKLSYMNQKHEIGLFPQEENLQYVRVRQIGQEHSFKDLSMKFFLIIESMFIQYSANEFIKWKELHSTQGFLPKSPIGLFR